MGKTPTIQRNSRGIEKSARLQLNVAALQTRSSQFDGGYVLRHLM
jgi:hypothetical protein